MELIDNQQTSENLALAMQKIIDNFINYVAKNEKGYLIVNGKTINKVATIEKYFSIGISQDNDISEFIIEPFEVDTKRHLVSYKDKDMGISASFNDFLPICIKYISTVKETTSSVKESEKIQHPKKVQKTQIVSTLKLTKKVF